MAMQKQSGCMSSFLQIFDRQQMLAGKRIHSTKRLPHSTGVGASPETVSSGDSQELSQELGKQELKKHAVVVVPASPYNSQSSPASNKNGRSISPVLVPTVDEYDNQSRQPSVVARLMGLEPLTSSDQKPPVTVKSPALPRSVQVVRSKYIDSNNFQLKQPNQSQKQSVERIVRDERSNVSSRDSINGKSMENESPALEHLKIEASGTSPRRSRSLFHSGDFFQEQNQSTAILNGDFENKLKMRGMDGQYNDLNSLKQILEVLELKGLLHPTNHRNFVCDRNLHSDESSIHLKQWRSLASALDHHRSVNDSRGACRHASEHSFDISLKRDGGAGDRSFRIPVKVRTSSPNRIESNLKSCNSIIKRKPLSIKINSPIDSNKPTSVHHSGTRRSQRNQKPTESSSINSPNQIIIKNVVTDDESQRSKFDGYIEGKRLLERCDKLLHSIAEINSATESSPSSATVLPSPVSVLDAGFDKDESSSSSSHSIDFKGPTVDFEEENCHWSPIISQTKSSEHEEFISDDSDFIYISEILQLLQKDSNSIEKELYNIKNTSNVSKHHRKLVFDVIIEILDRNKQLPPWKTSIQHSRTLLKQIWFEFLKIRAINSTGECLMEFISGVLKKDLAEIKDWGDYPIESSEAILNVERMIFKDLVSEAIEDLDRFSGECVFSRTRRRLVF